MRLFDAHNHLQDERFGGRQHELIAACRAAGVARMVVNGTCETDWPAVAELAYHHPDLVLPSFGYHPWYVAQRTSQWEQSLVRFLDANPGSGVGEIGLDRWKRGLDFVAQEEVFARQLQLAAERNRPVSIHCLQAWGRLLDCLRAGPRPVCGFLLHSYGGPAEMVAPLADLGAYFSLPGYFAHERKQRQREAFLQVPPHRLLIETDAPDQRLPDASTVPETTRLIAGEVTAVPLAGEQHPLTDPRTGQPLNHPANLTAVYTFAARLFSEPLEILAPRVEANFRRLFGASLSP
jgi:TatD DNase family protein